MKIANADKLKKHFENVVDVHLFTVPTIQTIIDTFSSEVPELTGWIPISFRELTDEERKELDPAIRFKWTCPLPDDMEDVLITTRYGSVQIATFEITDEGSFFDEMDEDDVLAWMPLPKPYSVGGTKP